MRSRCSSLPAIALAVLAVAAAAVAFVVERGEGRTETGRAGGVAGRAGAPPPPLVEPVLPESSRSETLPRSAGVRGQPVANVPWLEVRAVRAGSGTPVEDASVRVASHRELDGVAMGWRPLEERTDASGRVRIPAPEEDGVVVAGTDGLRGECEVSAGETELLVVELVPEPSIRVRVRDHAGAPAEGVRVRLELVGRTTRRRDERTGEDGVARFPHAGAWSAERVGELWAVVDELLAEDLRVVVPRDPLPADPVEIALPPAGEIELVVDVRELATVAVSVLPVSYLPPSFFSDLPSKIVALEDGRALVRPVGLGLRLRATLRRGPAHGFDGPTRPSERRIVELPTPPPPRTLVARAVDETGEPVAGTVFTAVAGIHLEGRAGSKGTHSIETDERGRLEVEAPLGDSHGQHDGRVALTLLHARESGPVAVGKAVRELPLDDGATDLGEVRLAPAPLLAAGTVVDAAGATVAGARVVARAPSRSGLPPVEERTAPDGSFELHGAPAAGGTTLTALEEGYVPSAPLHVAAGAKGLELRLEPEARVEGCIVADEGVPLRELLLVLEASTDSVPQRIAGFGSPGRRASGAIVRRDGCFTAGGFLPGRYELRLTLPGGERFVARRGLDLAAGTTDLGAVDVRGLLRAIRLAFVDEEGAPVRGVRVTLRPPDGSSGSNVVNVDGAEALVVTSLPALDLDATAKGRRRVRVERVEDDAEVVLPRGIPVRLVLAGGLPALPEGVTLSARIGPPRDSRDISQRLAEVTVFDASGTAELVAEEEGLQQVTLYLCRSSGGIDKVGRLEPDSGGQVDVAGPSVVHEIALDLATTHTGFWR